PFQVAGKSILLPVRARQAQAARLGGPRPESGMSAKYSERLRVSQAEVDAFQADGAVVLRQLLEEHEVALLRAGIDENLAHPSPRAKVASAPGDPGFFLEDFWCWQDNERYREFIFASALGEVGARLMRSTTARLYHDHMLTKEPGTRQRTPWHQDQPYYNISGWQNCSFWHSSGSRQSRVDARVRRGVPSRAVADAALIPGRTGPVVPGRRSCRAARHRCRPKSPPAPGLGAATGGRGVLSHADAARLGRCGGR